MANDKLWIFSCQALGMHLSPKFLLHRYIKVSVWLEKKKKPQTNILTSYKYLKWTCFLISPEEEPERKAVFFPDSLQDPLLLSMRIPFCTSIVPLLCICVLFTWKVWRCISSDKCLLGSISFGHRYPAKSDLFLLFPLNQTTILIILFDGKSFDQFEELHICWVDHTFHHYELFHSWLLWWLLNVT